MFQLKLTSGFYISSRNLNIIFDSTRCRGAIIVASYTNDMF